MNIPPEYLRRDYLRARDWWGQLIDQAELANGIPRCLLYATCSRETNLGRHWRTPPPATWPPEPTSDDLTYYVRHAGDEGHGRGIGQVDDRSHAIPPGWATNVAWQVGRSAEILAAALRREGVARTLARVDHVTRACNRYNSGQPLTEYTTDNYGPDVVERWLYLLTLAPEPEPDPWAQLFVPVLCG